MSPISLPVVSAIKGFQDRSNGLPQLGIGDGLNPIEQRPGRTGIPQDRPASGRMEETAQRPLQPGQGRPDRGAELRGHGSVPIGGPLEK